MGLIFSLWLVLLGVLATQNFIGEKLPKAKGVLAKLNSYSEIIGMVGLLFGFIWLLSALSMMRFLGMRPVMVLSTLVMAVFSLLLGMIYSLSLLHKIMNEPTPGFLLKADKWRASLLPNLEYMGATAIIFGLISLFHHA